MGLDGFRQNQVIEKPSSEKNLGGYPSSFIADINHGKASRKKNHAAAGFITGAAYAWKEHGLTQWKLWIQLAVAGPLN